MYLKSTWACLDQHDLYDCSRCAKRWITEWQITKTAEWTACSHVFVRFERCETLGGVDWIVVFLVPVLAHSTVQTVIDLQRQLQLWLRQLCIQPWSWWWFWVCFLSSYRLQGSWMRSRFLSALEQHWHACEEIEHQMLERWSNRRASQFFWLFAFRGTVWQILGNAFSLGIHFYGYTILVEIVRMMILLMCILGIGRQYRYTMALTQTAYSLTGHYLCAFM